VRLHGRVADEQLFCDLGVREAARDMLQHFELSRRQLGELRRRRPHRLRWAADELLDDSTRDRRGQQRVPLRHRTDAGNELLGRDVLEQEATRARPERVVDVLVHVEGRQHHDFRVHAVGCEQPARRLDPIDLRHADVHEHDVRSQAQRLRHGVRAVGSLAGHLDVLLGIEDHAKARAH
jgi:hypothetical protein